MSRQLSACAVAVCIATSACAALHTVATADGDTATFATSIDAGSVDEFIASVGERPIKRIVVTSDGGEITAGVRLGNWILDRGLDVEVHGVCASSCANYLFPAGRHRIIDDGGIVIWHGSALQANFRAMRADCPGRIGELEHATGNVVDRYQWALDDARQACDYFFAATRQQAAFFARVGVDETITRMGQEPRDFHAIWTVSVATMARFGITDVEAPAGYASHEYLQRFNTTDDPDPILVLGFDAAGAVVEEAR